MNGNTLTDLRAQLFDTIAALRDKDHPMELDRAKAVGNIAQIIVNSAKVEVDYLRATDSGAASPFLGGPQGQPALPGPGAEQKAGETRRTVHRIR